MVWEILFEIENWEIRLFQEISLTIVVKNQQQRMKHLAMDDKQPKQIVLSLCFLLFFYSTKKKEIWYEVRRKSFHGLFFFFFGSAGGSGGRPCFSRSSAKYSWYLLVNWKERESEKRNVLELWVVLQLEVLLVYQLEILRNRSEVIWRDQEHLDNRVDCHRDRFL